MKIEELKQIYSSRVTMLLDKLRDIDYIAKRGERTTVDACFFGTLSVIDALYGDNSAQSKALMESRKAYTKTQYSSEYELNSLAKSLKGTLLNIQEELEHGLIRNIAAEATGVVIGDLVSLAKAELKAGYIDVAAVLASAALEDALKRKAESLGSNVDNKTLDSVIGILKSKSFFKGAQVPIVSSYVKLRNSAMHADWSKIQEADVSSLIGFLEPFLLEHFVS